MDYDAIKEIFFTNRNILSVMSKYNNETMVEGLMNDSELTDKSIQFLIGCYYLYEVHKGENEIANPQFVEAIKDHSHEKEALCDWFRKSKVFAENVISDYFISSIQGNLPVRINDIKKDEKDYEVIKNLMSKYHYVKISYITTNIRINNYNMILSTFNIPKTFSNGFIQNIEYTDDQMINSILSDVYSFLKYQKIDNKFTYILENKDVKEIKDMFSKDLVFFSEIMAYYVQMFYENYPDFYEIYYTNEHQDKNYAKRMTKLNPLYVVDKIAVQPIDTK